MSTFMLTQSINKELKLQLKCLTKLDSSTCQVIAYIALLSVFFFSSAAIAQEEDAPLPPELQPPQILSSELAKKTELLRGELLVDFVAVDTDKIVSLKIDGKEQDIVPGRIVSVTKLFNFKRRRTSVKVEAVDELGNISKKVFTVRAIKTESLQGGKKQWFVSLALRSENDSNPTNINDESVSKAASSTVSNFIVGTNSSLGQAFLSRQSTAYVEDFEEAIGNIDSDVTLLGLSQTFFKKAPVKLRLIYTISDTDIASSDYSVNNSITLSSGTGRYLLGGKGYGIDATNTQKKFADKIKDAASTTRTKIGLRVLNQTGVASIIPSVTTGNDSQGDKSGDSDFNFTTLSLAGSFTIKRFLLNLNYQQQDRQYDKNSRKDARNNLRTLVRFNASDKIKLSISQTSFDIKSSGIKPSSTDPTLFESFNTNTKRNITSLGLQGLF